MSKHRKPGKEVKGSEDIVGRMKSKIDRNETNKFVICTTCAYILIDNNEYSLETISFPTIFL